VPRTGFLYGMGGTPDGREMIRLGVMAYADAFYETE